MNKFTKVVWTLVKVGMALALVPTLLFFITQVLPAVFTTPPGAWAK